MPGMTDLEASTRTTRVSTLELSFDPVIVFTITQLTTVLADKATLLAWPIESWRAACTSHADVPQSARR
jgi:low temperature requirement protein LtrA